MTLITFLTRERWGGSIRYNGGQDLRGLENVSEKVPIKGQSHNFNKNGFSFEDK